MAEVFGLSRRDLRNYTLRYIVEMIDSKRPKPPPPPSTSQVVYEQYLAIGLSFIQEEMSEPEKARLRKVAIRIAEANRDAYESHLREEKEKKRNRRRRRLKASPWATSPQTEERGEQ